MRIEVTKHNNVRHDDVLYVAGQVFEAEDDAAKALIEAGAAVEVEAAEAAPEVPSAEEPTYAELKERAKALGLPVNGKKDELQARVEAAEAEEAAKEASDAGPDGKEGSDGSDEGDKSAE